MLGKAVRGFHFYFYFANARSTNGHKYSGIKVLCVNRWFVGKTFALYFLSILLSQVSLQFASQPLAFFKCSME